MNKDELLVELSDLIDAKNEALKKSLELKMETGFSRLDQKIDSGISRLETSISKLEQKVDADVSRLDASILSLEQKVDANISRLDQKIDSHVSRLDQKIDSSVSRLETAIRHRDILIENEVIPRLKILEECYLTTSNRYQEGVIKMDSLDEDVTIMKKVITDHSKRLNALEQSTAAS